MNDTGAIARARASDGLERGRDMLDTASRKAEAARDDVEGRVRNNPLAALGIAFGVGVLVAALSRR